MDKVIFIALAVFAGIILLGIIKKIVKTIIGLALIAALIFGGIYIYNTYPNEVKNVSNTIQNVVDNTTVKDYLRVDENGKYYVYVEKKDDNGKFIYPKGKIFDYPNADISIDKIIDIASGDFKNLKRQYYKIDKHGNPIVPAGVTPPRKFIQPNINK